ncbi:MAG: N-acetylmuramoyl-L-alanine amidase [Bacteroidales bacterium]|nr:N-acetylmuramoyl-L-alanine amidase [Bacteroidales bacterium]
MCLLLTFVNANSFCQKSEQITKVVIDAGHGGKDSGCLGKVSKEKDVTLSVALQLGKLITDNCKNVQVIYTRKTDVFVELYKRAQIANNQHANLFISIHCNAAENRNSHGIETFIMGVDKTGANSSVAKKENSAMLLEKNIENNYEGFNPNSPEADIIFSLYSSAFLRNSALLADKVQKNLVNDTQLSDREVKQAGFWVLYKVAMPSILVELGFLTNAKEENFLLNSGNQNLIAASLYNSFVEYKNQIEHTNTPKLHVNKVIDEDAPLEKVSEKTSEKSNPTTVSTFNRSGLEPTPKPATSNNSKIEVNVDVAPNGSQTVSYSSSQNTFTTTKPAQPTPIQSAKTTMLTQPKTETPAAAITSSNEIVFRIQFFVSVIDYDVKDVRFANAPDVRKYFENGFWKYTSGNFSQYDKMTPAIQSVKKSFPDAFVIAFEGETKIPVTEAKQRVK